MSWRAEADEIRRRRELARACGGEASVARQHEAGKLTVRERIDKLMDAGSFQEVGQLAGRAVYAEGKLAGFEPAPYVMGLGRISDRPVAVGARTTPSAPVPASAATAARAGRAASSRTWPFTTAFRW